MNEIKALRMFDAVTAVPDEVIEEARQIPLGPPSGGQQRRGKSPVWKWAAGIAAALALIAAGIVFIPRFAVPVGADAEMIAVPEYPEKRVIGLAKKTPEGAKSFLTASVPVFLGGAEGENRVYSPANLYMALSMLAELTDGESREQILSLLGADTVEEQRENANALWLAAYREKTSEQGACLLANSVWLNEDVRFKTAALDVLAKDYYASSCRGTMGSPKMDEALRAWVNEQTGGVLKDAVDGITTDPRTVLELFSTVYFRGIWANRFKEENTEPGVFHAPDGDKTVPFLRKQGEPGVYYWGEKFSAVSKSFSNGYEMLFVLPDEGLAPDDLLADAEWIDFMSGDRYEWEKNKVLRVNLSVPKFDVSSDVDLSEGLKSLGVTDVFESNEADFSPLTDEGGVFVSNAAHAARVMIDEDGCTAASYVEISAAGGMLPPDEVVDFTVDRPFLFLIVKRELPLYIGVICQP